MPSRSRARSVMRSSRASGGRSRCRSAAGASSRADKSARLWRRPRRRSLRVSGLRPPSTARRRRPARGTAAPRSAAAPAAAAPPPGARPAPSVRRPGGRARWPRRRAAAVRPVRSGAPRPAACACCAASCSPSVARPASASATSRKAIWIALSYCATAMSRAARAASRLAWLRPASNSGCSNWPLNVQAVFSNRPESSVLAMPTLPVSEMRGKKAARAAPMLALAAISCCSAWRMSGRCSSTSEGRPAGTRPASAPSAAARRAGRPAAAGPAAAPARSGPAHAGAAASPGWHAPRPPATRRCAVPPRRPRRLRSARAPACNDASRDPSVLRVTATVRRRRAAPVRHWPPRPPAPPAPRAGLRRWPGSAPVRLRSGSSRGRTGRARRR